MVEGEEVVWRGGLGKVGGRILVQETEGCGNLQLCKAHFVKYFGGELDDEVLNEWKAFEKEGREKGWDWESSTLKDKGVRFTVVESEDD